MASVVSLRGGCSCGRNQYTIFSPPNLSESLQVVFENRSHHSVSLRVPLSQIQSTTYAFYPDETHASIRKVFSPHHAPHTMRHFCGICGTPLSHWSEESDGESEFVCVNIGSLKNDSVELLEEEGLLSSAEGQVSTLDRFWQNRNKGAVTDQQREVRGNPWFEEMIEGSELGRIKRQRGGESSADGKSSVEWEVFEITNETGDGSTGTGKRKLDQIGKGGSDVEMNVE